MHNPLEWVDPLGLAKAGCDGEKNKKTTYEGKAVVMHLGKLSGMLEYLIASSPEV
ncbi:hypothetical protein V6M93_21765 [Pectobacterium brasiliense]|uniref:hypothetical protein n=1 Tax=Pectobacterium brasiliense TaxID=180957 RepID=UPI00367097AE